MVTDTPFSDEAHSEDRHHFEHRASERGVDDLVDLANQGRFVPASRPCGTCGKPTSFDPCADCKLDGRVVDAAVTAVGFVVMMADARAGIGRAKRSIEMLTEKHPDPLASRLLSQSFSLLCRVEQKLDVVAEM